MCNFSTNIKWMSRAEASLLYIHFYAFIYLTARKSRRRQIPLFTHIKTWRKIFCMFLLLQTVHECLFTLVLADLSPYINIIYVFIRVCVKNARGLKTHDSICSALEFSLHYKYIFFFISRFKAQSVFHQCSLYVFCFWLKIFLYLNSLFIITIEKAI